MSSCTSRPLTARSKLLSRDSIEALVLAETASACVIDARPGKSESTWLQRHADQPFSLLGLTSLAGVVLRDRLSSLTGLDLPTTLVFDYPTPEAVSAYLYRRLFEPETSTSLPTPTPESSIVDSGVEPIAIISMACRYPGGISSPEDLWRVVSDEVDVTSEFPDDVSKTSRFHLIYSFLVPCHPRSISFSISSCPTLLLSSLRSSIYSHKYRSAAGTSPPCIIPTPTHPAPPRRDAALFSTTWPTLTPGSSGCPHGRPSPQTPSRGCCWRRRGSWRSEAALPLHPSAEARRASLLASCMVTMQTTAKTSPVNDIQPITVLEVD